MAPNQRPPETTSRLLKPLRCPSGARAGRSLSRPQWIRCQIWSFACVRYRLLVDNDSRSVAARSTTPRVILPSATYRDILPYRGRDCKTERAFESVGGSAAEPKEGPAGQPLTINTAPRAKFLVPKFRVGFQQIIGQLQRGFGTPMPDDPAARFRSCLPSPFCCCVFPCHIHLPFVRTMPQESAPRSCPRGWSHGRFVGVSD